MSAFALLAANAAIVIVLFAALWLAAQRTRDPSFVDAFWALGITLMAVTSFVMADGWQTRQLVITGLALVWGLRLGGYLFWRWRHEGADKRYAALVRHAEETRGWGFGKTTALFVFAPQAALLFIASLPVQLGQVAAQPAAFGALAFIGIALAVFGIAYETIADVQLTRFKADPANKGKVLDTGVWGWSRHPNYFGEACAWWGIWLIAAETTPGLFAVIGPLFVTWTLMRWSGAPLLERGLKKSRPGYEAYVARVSAFVPLPPKRG